ncbi:putative Mg(2+) transport ATPase [compost metagenome]
MQDYIDIVEHLAVALAAGGLIGFERSYHGRPAGFRTHTLVCVASSALMLVTMYQSHWYPEAFAGRVALDPTRMAQGIMTGIGFLGAGVIFKEGLTVRGLTTAASIWITAAIGILAGIGFFFPLVVTTLITLGTLSVFRWIEAKVPGEFYAHLLVRCPREGGMNEEELRHFLHGQGFSVANMNYASRMEPRCYEYQMVIKARHEERARDLAEALGKSEKIMEFRMSPTGD